MKPHFEPCNSKYMAGCQQPFLPKMAGDNQLSAAIFGPKQLVTTGCQQPSPRFYQVFKQANKLKQVEKLSTTSSYLEFCGSVLINHVILSDFHN